MAAAMAATMGAATSPRVDAQRLRAHVVALTTDYHPRTCTRPGNLRAAARHIRRQLEAAGARVDEQPVEAGGERFSNVIARFGPEKGAVLVIGAHYDTAGE